jgi:hypothetical protein
LAVKTGKSKQKEEKSNEKLVLYVKIYLYDLTNTYFECNMQYSKTLEEIILNLRSLTSTSMRAVVVIDAGIATEENLAMLSENNFDYVCVSRSKLKGYRIDPTCCPVEIATLLQTKICSAQIGI